MKWNVDVMRLYVDSADGHVSSCLDGSSLFFLALCGAVTGRVLICCSVSKFLA
jgi:hypothetical protein